MYSLLPFSDFCPPRTRPEIAPPFSPPHLAGLGKTTLAHVVARHCGYHPFEINASDDRTAGNLTQRINDAVQMRAVLGGGKPNCVIVDEIDGATGGAEGVSAIAALLRIVNAGGPGGGGGGGKQQAGGRRLPVGRCCREGAGERVQGKGTLIGKMCMSTAHMWWRCGVLPPRQYLFPTQFTVRAGNADGDKPGGGEGGKQQHGGKRSGGRLALPALRRPIICICNDLYAPALRPLRDVARVFHFKVII